MRKVLNPYLIAVFCLTLPVILMTSLTEQRLLDTYDSILHLHRIIANANSLHEGLFWPRWYPNLFLGYGYPIGNYYTPGAHLIGAGFVLIGFQPVLALLLTQTLAILLGAFGAYAYARNFANRAAALVVTAMYVYTPFLLFQLYGVGNLPQLVGWGVLPWCFWAINHCIAHRSSRYVVLGALFIALMTLSHQLVAFYALPTLGIYLIVMTFSTHGLRPRYYVYPLAAYWLGFFLAAIYWLPAVLEAQFIQPIELSATGNVSIERNFVLLETLFAPVRSVDAAARFPRFDHTIGLFPVVLTLGAVGMLFLRQNRQQRAHILFGVGVAALCVFLITYHSYDIWTTVPGMALFQQPWRLLALIYVVIIPPVAILMNRLLRGRRVWFAPVLIALAIVNVLPILYPANPLLPEMDDLTPASYMPYEIETGNYATVAFNEYMPVWVESRDDLYACESCYDDWNWRIYLEEPLLPPEVQIDSADGTRPRATDFMIETPEQFDFVLHQLYFPGWRARLNGEIIDIQPTEPGGLMSVDIPSGTSQLTIWFAGTPVHSVAFAISLWAVALTGAFAWRAWRKPPSGSQNRVEHKRVALVSALLLVGFALLSDLYIKPQTDLFRIPTDRDTPAYMDNALDTTFIDPNTQQPLIELLGYGVNHSDSIQYGDWLYVDLYWRAIQPLDRNWRVLVALADMNGVPWLQSDTPAPGIIPTTGWSTERYMFDRHILPITDDTPPYLGQITVTIYESDTTLTTPTGQPFTALRPLRVDEHGEQHQPSQTTDVTFGDLMTLHGYTFNSADDTLTLYWHTTATTDEDYRLFIHFYDGNTFLEAADRRPIDVYPTNQWLPGQNLEASYTLTPPVGTDSLLIGMYSPTNGTRLPATGESTRDNGLVIPIESP